MADKTLTIDASKFLKFCDELQKKLPTDDSFAEVFEQETLSVLRTCAKKLKRTTLAKAGGKFNPRSKNFKGWVRMNGKFYWCGATKGKYKGAKYSPSMWNKLQARMKQLRERAETRVGLSKAIFFRVAKELKMRRYSTGWSDSEHIKSAMNKSGGIGSAARNGPIWSTKAVASTQRNLRSKNPSFQFTISSTNSFNPFTGGTGIVESSFKGREKYFEKAVKHGMMKSTEEIAKKYPNINIKSES